jgi:hypothetical protein
MRCINTIKGKISAAVFFSAGLALVLGGSMTVMASDPVGIYALVEKVVFEPNEQNPERVQIWGTFVLAKQQMGNDYEQPVRGYIYLSAQKGKENVAKKEWADLKNLAGTDQCVAFGNRYAQMKEKVRVRKAADKVELPDTYPTGVGLVKIGNSHPQAQTLRSYKGSASWVAGAARQF